MSGKRSLIPCGRGCASDYVVNASVSGFASDDACGVRQSVSLSASASGTWTVSCAEKSSDSVYFLMNMRTYIVAPFGLPMVANAGTRAACMTL